MRNFVAGYGYFLANVHDEQDIGGSGHDDIE